MNLRQLAFALICSLGAAGATGAASAQQICAADTNGNGTIDQNEIQQCQGFKQVCSTVEQTCNASSSTTSCPYTHKQCRLVGPDGEQEPRCPGHLDLDCTDDGTGRYYCDIPPDPSCTTTTTTYTCPGDSTQSCAANSSGTQVCHVVDPNCSTSSSNGYLCPISKQACKSSVGVGGTSYSCPSDSSRPCIDDGSGTRYCSPYDCQDKSAITPVYNDPINQTPPQNDGAKDAAGQCLDNLRIFAGTPSRCREAGDQTVWQNCCHNNNPTISDTMGARGQPDQVTFKDQSSTFEFWSNQCDQKDQQTSLLASSGYCISVGSYCAEKWPLIGCVQTNESYCCFNSMLAKIIQQQGRAQLPEMGNFGTPENPNCRGFSMDEFQAIDFSKVDFSAYYDQIHTDTQANVENQAQQNVQQNVGP